MTAADPLNLTGILDAHPRVPSLASNRVAYLGGAAVAALIAGEIVWPATISAQEQLRVAEGFAAQASRLTDSRRPRESPTKIP